MDEFEITSEVGRGTTVTMTKWRDGDDERATDRIRHEPKGAS